MSGTTTSSSPQRAALVALDDAIDQLLAHIQRPLGTETVATMTADGRVLRETVQSRLDVPPLDNSAMDGYAVRAAECARAGVELPVSQRIAAGSVGQPLAQGTAARIFTGAPIPAGADAVVMQENTEALQEGACVRVVQPPLVGDAIRRAGEDVAKGDDILVQSQRLTPAAIGLAAGIGQAELRVSRRPRVALLSTGDELINPGDVPPEQMKPGAIYNSNRFFLHALLQRLGCEVTDLGAVADRFDATVATLQEAGDTHDVVITTGGVSVGDEDHVKPAVQRLGRLDLWQIAIKPGKPFAYGQIRRGNRADDVAHFIGLPGNPVSSFVTFAVLVRPFLLRLQGVTDVAMPVVPTRADFAWPKPGWRREFLRVRRNDQAGLDLFANQGSGVLTSMHWADGVVDLAAGATIAQGDKVNFVALAELF